MEAYKLEVVDPRGSWKNDLSPSWIGIPRYKSFGSPLVIQSSSIRNVFQGFYLLCLEVTVGNNLLRPIKQKYWSHAPYFSGTGNRLRRNILSLCLAYFCNCSLLLHCMYFLLHGTLLMSGGNAPPLGEGLDQAPTKIYSVTMDGIHNPLVLHHASTIFMEVF